MRLLAEPLVALLDLWAMPARQEMPVEVSVDLQAMEEPEAILGVERGDPAETLTVFFKRIRVELAEVAVGRPEVPVELVIQVRPEGAVRARRPEVPAVLAMPAGLVPLAILRTRMSPHRNIQRRQ